MPCGGQITGFYTVLAWSDTQSSTADGPAHLGPVLPSAFQCLVACGKGMAAQLPVSDCAGVLSSVCRLKTGTALSRSCCTENSAPHCSQMLTAYGAGAATTNPLTGNCGIICIYRKLVPEVLPAMVYTIKCMKIYILDCFSCLMQQLSSMSRPILVSSPVTESLLGALIRIESISL